MASNVLNPYVNSTTQQSFDLVSTMANGSEYRAGARDIALPYSVVVQRKLTPPTSAANDHVYLRVRRSEKNASTGKLATAQVNLDISIPKDSSVLTLTELKKMCSVIASLLNESTVMEATSVAITKLVEGRDL